MLDLDTPIVEWVPEFTLADGRAGDVTARVARTRLRRALHLHPDNEDALIMSNLRS